MMQFSFAAACGYEPSMWEAAQIRLHMEALILQGCDAYLVPLPELPPTSRVGRLPSLRALKASKAAREMALQPTKDSSSEMMTNDDACRIKFSWQCPCRGNQEVRVSNHSVGVKGQGLIPSSVAIAGAASLGLRRRSRHTSEPPRKMVSKSALTCPERAKFGNVERFYFQRTHLCSYESGAALTPKPPAVPRTGPGGRRLYKKNVLQLVATEVSPQRTKELLRDEPL